MILELFCVSTDARAPQKYISGKLSGSILNNGYNDEYKMVYC